METSLQSRNDLCPPSMQRAVAEHRPYLMRFAGRRLHDPALVEDVVHDTIVAALQGAAQFAGRASTRTWLTGILLHRIADAVRRERRDARGQGDGVEASHGDVATDAIEVAPKEGWIDRRDPQRELEARQSLTAVESSLAGLPPATARIVLMRDVQGLSTDETAIRLGVTRASVSKTLHRARSRLRKGLLSH